jgi:glutathione synthase/RimK-type ligase-like ATP-grasp enzyme
VVWTDPDPAVPWEAFDLVVANGAWDNIHRPHDFLAWADAVSATTPVVNSPDVLRWNLDKRYLAVLADLGVPTVPTTWVSPAATSELLLPPGEFVVKPTISGGGFETARYRPEESDDARAHIRRLLEADRTVMIQPYQAAVDAQGETGLIFLGGRYSHAISKGPLLRVGAGPQDHLWADERIGAVSPTGAQQETAVAALAGAEQLFGPTTYARVDLIAGADGAPVVLELELLDPALFFETDPAAAVRFAEVLAARIGQLPSG